MTGAAPAIDADDPAAPPMGLIVLSVDETIEAEMRHAMADRRGGFFVSRVPSGTEATGETLSAIEGDLSAAADLLPKSRPYPVVGFGCTSASALIGSGAVARAVQATCNAKAVTNPFRALTAAAAEAGVARLALLSPYIDEVNVPLRRALSEAGLSTDIHASWGISEEAQVARISVASIVEEAVKLGSDPGAEAVFISCTNLRTRTAIPAISERIGKPVFASNQVLAWHMKRLEATTP